MPTAQLHERPCPIVIPSVIIAFVIVGLLIGIVQYARGLAGGTGTGTGNSSRPEATGALPNGPGGVGPSAAPSPG